MGVHAEPQSDLRRRGAAPRIVIADSPDRQTTAAPDSVSHVLAGPGRPLEPGVRHDFEQRFNHDFAAVRVHTGSVAARSVRDVGARAYTVGRDIVFGVGQYTPDTPDGQLVLAHELTHVAQQDSAPRTGAPARLQRLGVGEAVQAGVAAIRSRKQYLSDLIASVKESPQHALEFFTEEVWQQIKAHWVRIVLVTTGLLVADEVVAALTAAPEPTLLTKVIAAALQVAIFAVLGHFAAVEVKGAYEEGVRWLALVKAAKGDPAAISAASRSFVRMVWHIVMAVLAAAGLRARIREVTAPGGAAPVAAREGAAGGPGVGGAEAPGGSVTPIANHPRFRPKVEPGPGPGPSAFGSSGTAQQLAPVERPTVEPAVEPAVPEPTKGVSPSARPRPGPGVQPIPAVGAGVSAGQKPAPRPPFVLRLPVEKEPHLGRYRMWLGTLQSDPDYDRNSPNRPQQRSKWRDAHRMGGSHGIPLEVYERGHALGLTGEEGERRIRLPDWTRTRSTAMEVDHIIELQVTPLAMRRDIFDKVENYELLDESSNDAAGARLKQNVAKQRAIQVAFDPSAATRILLFDRVELDDGSPGERWSSEEIRAGEHLDFYRGGGT